MCILTKNKEFRKCFLNKRKKLHKKHKQYEKKTCNLAHIVIYYLSARITAHWSSGQDASLSRWKLGFDSRMGHQKKKAAHLAMCCFLFLRFLNGIARHLRHFANARVRIPHPKIGCLFLNLLVHYNGKTNKTDLFLNRNKSVLLDLFVVIQHANKLHNFNEL